MPRVMPPNLIVQSRWGRRLLREMDGAGVQRTVLVPPTWEGDRNDTSLEAARCTLTVSRSWDVWRSAA